MPGVGQPGTRSFSNEGYKIGDLKRRLPIATVAVMQTAATNGAVQTGIFTYRLLVKNLSRGLSVHIAAGVVGNDTSTIINPASIPAGAATMQLTPTNVFADRPPLLLRPIFQNPAIANNANNALPQDLPFGWEFETVSDQVYVDITFNAALFVLTFLNGTLVIEVGIEYTGDWPFPEAPKYQLSQVQLIEAGAPKFIDTRDLA